MIADLKNVISNNSSVNEIVIEDFMAYPEIRRLAIFVYATTIISGAFGNCVLLASICKRRRFGRVTNAFLANLAVCSLLMLLLDAPVKLFSLSFPSAVGNFLSDVVCRAGSYSVLLAGSCSLLTTLMVSIERYVAVCHPIKFRAVRNFKAAAAVIALIWVTCGLSMLPLALQSSVAVSVLTAHGGRGDENFRWTFCLTEIDTTAGEASSAYFAFVIVAFLLTPIGLAIAAYLRVVVQLRRKRLCMTAEHVCVRKRLAKMMVIVLLIFVASWSPFLAACVVSAANIGLRGNNIVSVYLFALWVVFVGYAVTPYVYIHFSNTFRNEMRVIPICSCMYWTQQTRMPTKRRISIFHSHKKSEKCPSPEQSSNTY